MALRGQQAEVVNRSPNVRYEVVSYLTYDSEDARGVPRIWPKEKLMNKTYRRTHPAGWRQ
eukprot:2374826-Karenia_brevis.AAC.1